MEKDLEQGSDGGRSSSTVLHVQRGSVADMVNNPEAARENPIVHRDRSTFQKKPVPVQNAGPVSRSGSISGRPSSMIPPDGGYPDYDEEEEPESETTRKIKMAIKLVLLLGVIVYSIAAYVIDFDRAIGLFVGECVVVGYLILSYGLDKFGAQLSSMMEPLTNGLQEQWQKKTFRFAVLGLIAAGWITLVVFFVKDSMERVQSVSGVFAFVAMFWALSAHPKQVRWRPVLWGFGVEWVLGIIILKTVWGFEAFQWIGEQASIFLDYVSAGVYFVFSEELVNIAYFGFYVLPTVIFFSSFVSIMYYVGALQFVIEKIAWLMSRSLGTSASESLSCAGNIFIGQTEAPLLVRPFLSDMTLSEIHAVMTGGFATIAGGVLAAYVGMGIPAANLISASVMACPTALAMSKLMYPETEESKTKAGGSMKISLKLEERNIIEAASNGASAAIPLALNIGAMLIAFYALMDFFNHVLGYFGGLVNYEELSFEVICGYLFYPAAWLIGTPVADCMNVATLMGEKMFLNEFVAYEHLQRHMEEGTMSERAITLSTFALCGFANFGSMGIQLGGLSPLAPHRKPDFARLVFRAMITGTFACFMNAAVAGIMIS